jgi:hypothetical protein
MIKPPENELKAEENFIKEVRTMFFKFLKPYLMPITDCVKDTTGWH